MASSPGPPLGCDRRLSRAARSILVRDVLPILRHHSATASSKRKRKSTDAVAEAAGPEDPSELWDILLSHLDNDKNTQKSNEALALCPLDPRHDALRYHEINSRPIPNPAHRGKPTHRNRHTGAKILHTCDICGKAFHTRYYLDLHLDRMHYMSWDGSQVVDPLLPGGENDDQAGNTTSGKQHWICPATDLCPSLGGTTECERIALETEPYYGPGSAGLGPEGTMVRAGWQRILLDDGASCHEDQMATRRIKCRELFSTCFSNNDSLLNELNAHVCDRLTCEDRLHGLAGSISNTFHHLREEWDHHHHHNIGIWSCLFVLLLVIFYGGMVCGFWGGNNGRGGGILKSKSRSGASSILRGSRNRGTMGRMYSGKKKAY